MKKSSLRHPAFFLIPFIVAIFSLALVFISLLNGWFGPAAGVGGDFCEASHDGLVKQPSNTYSNLAFVFFGLIAAWQIYKGKFDENTNSLTRTTFMPIFFCTLAVLLGPGSMAMHASEAKLGGYFDLLSMYLIAALMFSYASVRLFSLNKLFFTIIFIAVLMVCHFFYLVIREIPVFGFAGSFIFGMFIVSSMIFEAFNKLFNKPDISFKWAVYSSLAFIIAFLIWLTGHNSHSWCDPDSIIQAHAIWHILNGVAIYLLFRYYVSENRLGI